MSNVVMIHNAVNERAWREIGHWEATMHPECNCPKLKEFHGRPRDYSPKARLLNLLVQAYSLAVTVCEFEIGLAVGVQAAV